MKWSELSGLMAICCLMTLGILVLGCSDDDNPASSREFGWAPLGTGTNNTVFSLAVYNNTLMTGGEFTTAGGVNASHIAVWNGSAWSTLGTGIGKTNPVMAHTGPTGEPIAGETVTTASKIWNGTSVEALAVYGNNLIAAGSFMDAGGVSVQNIAAWNGSSWATLGSGIIGTIADLTIYDGKLIAGGFFATAGGVTVNNIAAWNGTSWTSLGTGMDYGVKALTVYDNKLIAGGNFTTAGGVSATRIAAWDGSVWTPLGSGLNENGPSCFAIFDGKLIAAGQFTTAGGIGANRIAAWDGSAWAHLGTGVDNTVRAFTEFDNKLIVGGSFTSAGGVSANRIAVWGPK